MIVDHIDNLSLYEALNPYIKLCKTYLDTHDLSKMEPGKYDIDGNHAWVIISEYDSKDESECQFEGHQHYADIQLIIKGVESFGYQYRDKKYIEKMTLLYSEEKDVDKMIVNSYTKVRLDQGMFALVFPDDLHMPNMKYDQSVSMKKAVFKIFVK